MDALEEGLARKTRRRGRRKVLREGRYEEIEEKDKIKKEEEKDDEEKVKKKQKEEEEQKESSDPRQCSTWKDGDDGWHQNWNTTQSHNSWWHHDRNSWKSKS